MRLKGFHTAGLLEAGCDEAGRGCLAGPVVAAAVVLNPHTRIPGLNDSKQLTEAQRNALRKLIETRAHSWAVGVVYPEEIDRINILNAAFLAMHKAIEQLSCTPELLLIDGNRFNPYRTLQHVCVIKGDAKYRSIAAASILAKTHRDEIMQQLHHEFPDYNWLQNKGYPTIEHRNTVLKIGPTPHHRKSFRVTEPQLKLAI